MPWLPTSSDSFRPLQRTVNSFLTGKTEWEQIVANRTLPFPQRVQDVAKSIDFNANKSMDEEVDRAAKDKTKCQLNNQIYAILHKLHLYQKLIEQIDGIRKTKVTDNDEEHLKLFDLIWSRLVTQSDDDHDERKMISKRWTQIGFQVKTKRIVVEFSF